MSAAPPIAALLTPRGRGAVATIGYRGDAARLDAAGLFRAMNGKPLAGQEVDRIVFGRWGTEPDEEVVVCRVSADRLEIHCHGGDAAAERILADLESRGVGRESWREFIERTEGAFAADIAEALAAAATARTAAIIARQAEGPLRDALQWISRADFASNRTEIRRRLRTLIHWSRFGLHLTQPWRVVLFGPPNVGKSSLINALVGFERAIVFDQPGTTRDVVTAETAFNGWPVRLSDTAGLRSEAEELEAAGIERAKAELAEADLRLLVYDRSEPPDWEFYFRHRPFTPGVIVLNKADLPNAWLEDSLAPLAVAVSAKTGEGVNELMERIVAELIPRVPSGDTAVPVTARQASMIRTAFDALVSGRDDAFRQAISAMFP